MDGVSYRDFSNVYVRNPSGLAFMFPQDLVPFILSMLI